MPVPVVTIEDIQAIYTIPDGIVSSVFIDAGTTIFTEWLVYLPYTQDYLKIMLTYFIVHLMQAFEPQTLAYAGMRIAEKGYGEFLKSTEYGQRVLLLDTNGYLAGFGMKKARLFSLGGNQRGCGRCV